MPNGFSLNSGVGLTATCVALCAMIVSARADENIRYKTVTHNTGAVTMDPADGIEGHLVGSAKFVGISLFDDGRVGSVTYIANFDYINGSGTYVTSETLKFDDGSVIRMKHTGSAKLQGKISVFPDGKAEITGGGGKYKGVTGSGEYHGARLGPFADGGDSYFEGTMTLKVP